MPDAESTLWSLVRGAAEGRTEDREAFARRYEPVIRAYLTSRWRQPWLRVEIDDATQEVFVACFKSQSALERVNPDRPGGFRAYLYGIVKNVARRVEERRARDGRRTSGGLDLDQVASDELTLSRVFDRAWAKSILRQAVRLHAERASEVDEAAVRRVDLLRLRFQDGLPIREIAEQWDMDPARLHREYARGRKEFAEALREVVRNHQGCREAAVDAGCARLIQFFH